MIKDELQRLSEDDLRKKIVNKLNLLQPEKTIESLCPLLKEGG